MPKVHFLCLIVGIMLLSVSRLSHAEAIPPELTPRVSPLSQKAAQLVIGMLRKDVIALLGEPTWAALPRDGNDFIIQDPSIAFSLYWKNPGCAPIAVDFNKQQKIMGWDQGRICLAGAEKLEPPAKYSCSKRDRTYLCK